MTTNATIVDVSLRDGLQDEAVIVPTSAKLEIAAALREAGLTELEVASFVNPKRVPQMADAESVIAGLPRDIRPSALVMNGRGLERALAAFDAAGYTRDAYNLVYVVSASSRHSVENSNQTIDVALATFNSVAMAARAAGCVIVGSISCASASPWPEEAISLDAVTDIAKRFRSGGCRSITLCDTVGCGTVDDIVSKTRAVTALLDTPPALHMHSLAGSAIASIRAGLTAGVRRFEGTLGGLGGCPFAPGAPGNADLRLLVATLGDAGITTNVHPNRLDQAEAALNRALFQG